MRHRDPTARNVDDARPSDPIAQHRRPSELIPPRIVDLPTPKSKQHHTRRRRNVIRHQPRQSKQLNATKLAASRQHGDEQQDPQEPPKQKQGEVVLEGHRRSDVLECVPQLLGRGRGEH